MFTSRVLPWLLIAVVVVAAGCGDESESSGGASTTAKAATNASSGADDGDAGSASLLYVVDFAKGSIEPGTSADTYVVRLTPSSEHVTWFADRPKRAAGREQLATFVDAFDTMFADSPPNAVIAVAHTSPDDATLTIDSVAREGTQLVLQARTIEGANEGQFADLGHVTKPVAFTAGGLFIDNFISSISSIPHPTPLECAIDPQRSGC